MPITISRSGQRTKPHITISQEERDRLWEAVLRAYIQKNPAILEEEHEEKKVSAADTRTASIACTENTARRGSAITSA